MSGFSRLGAAGLEYCWRKGGADGFGVGIRPELPKLPRRRVGACERDVSSGGWGTTTGKEASTGGLTEECARNESAVSQR